jgi:hypothetical protein
MPADTSYLGALPPAGGPLMMVHHYGAARRLVWSSYTFGGTADADHVDVPIPELLLPGDPEEPDEPFIVGG